MQYLSQVIRVIFLLIAISAAAQADQVDAYIKAEMYRQRISGLSVAIVRDGKVIRAKGYGQANMESSAPATELTVYQIGSLTKQFTATAIMLLLEDGKLQLDDKIVDRLPDLPAGWSAVNIRQLLNHTSGIRDYTEAKGFDAKRRLDSSPAELLNLIAQEPLSFAPGEKFNYSNTNYLLLGLLIEKLSGKSYDQFLDERVFTPLGMTQTRGNRLSAVITNRAQGYIRIPRAYQNAPYFSPTNAFGAGHLISTVSDLVKWDAALTSRKLLKESSLEEMWKPAVLSEGGTAEYGFGWDVKSVNGHRLIAHDGNISGFSSSILRFVDDKLTIIILTNFGGIRTETLAQGIAGQIQPELAKKLPQAIADPEPLTTERLKRVVIDMLNGEMTPEFFSEKLNRELGPLMARGKEQSREMNADSGRLEKFELLERKVSEQGLQLQYRATYEHQKRMIFITLDQAGKITNWGVRGAE